MSLLLLFRGDGDGPGPEPPSSVISVRERPPLWLTTEVSPPSGGYYRWAGDEPDPANKPSGRRFSSTMPGGHESCDQVLPRKPGLAYADLTRLSHMRVTGAGGEVAWEGRLERAPRVSGDQMAVTPSAVGWQAHLEDDRSASIVFIDRDLGRWQGPSAQRRLDLIAINQPHQSDASANWDASASVPGLAMDIQGQWVSPFRPIIEAWYDAGAGNRIGRIVSDFAGISNAAFVLVPYTIETSTATGGAESPGDVYAGVPGSFNFAPAVRYRYALIQWQYSATPAGTDGASHAVTLRSLGVHGDHGLTPQADTAGYLASDMVGYSVGRWAPLLRYSTGQDGSIQTSSFVVSQAAFIEPTTVSSILQEVSRYELPDWAVWDDRTFYYYPRGVLGRRWRARVGPARLEEAGPQVERLWNGIIVRFQDVDGSTRSVGPPGSGADIEDALLLDSDPENPATLAGIKRYALLDMGVGVSASAVQVGYRFLAGSRLIDNSGRAQLVGTVEDDRGIERPYWQVRAGDQISFVDSSDTSYRRIVRVDHQEDTLTASIDLDAPPDAMEQLLARLGASIAGIS